MIITTREINDVVIFDIEGEFRRSDVKEPSLPEFVKAQLDNGKKKLLVNFEKLEFIDSFGVGEILASYISVNNHGGALKLAAYSFEHILAVNPSEAFVEPLPDFLYTTEEDALEAFVPRKIAMKKWWQFWKF